MRRDPTVHVHSRDEAQRVLEEQREKGRRIQGTHTAGIDDLHVRWAQWQAWMAETRELLINLFDSTSIADDFYAAPLQWPTESAPLHVKYNILQRQEDQSQRRLADILGRIPAMPEVDSRPVAPASQGDLAINDESLRERVSDILAGPGPYDRAIREAGVVLEDRVRSRSGAAKRWVGVDLMTKAFGKSGLLVVTDLAAEQEAFHTLMRGFIGWFKNSASHRLSSESRERAVAIVAFADVLLAVVESANERARDPAAPGAPEV